MQIWFERKGDKAECHVYYDGGPCFRGVADVPPDYDREIPELFRGALERFPTEELLNASSVDWNKVLQTNYYVIHCPTSVFKAAEAPLSTALFHKVLVHWRTCQHQSKPLEVGKNVPKNWSPPAYDWVSAESANWKIHPKGAFQGPGSNNGQTEVLELLGSHFDLTQKLECHEDCTYPHEAPVSLKTYVIHLNDNQGWTIGQIADHLETLDIDIQQKEKV